MKLVKKMIVAGFCAASSLGMIAFPVSAMEYPLQEEIQEDVVFPKTRSIDELEYNQEEPETTGSQSDDTEEVLPVLPVQENTTQSDSPEVAETENEDETAVPAQEETAEEESETQPEGLQRIVEEEMEEESEDTPLLAVIPEYEPQESITEKMESKARLLMEEAMEETEEIVNDGIIYFDLEPNFDDLSIWQNEQSPYHQNRLWGQCTWFAWHRFYEIYGFNPGFTGSGYLVASQLVAAHPDKFELSSTPVAGSVFSYMNHTGIVVDVSEDGMLTIQDGNYDFVTNYDWNAAINDWATFTISLSDFLARGAVFANPIDIQVALR